MHNAIKSRNMHFCQAYVPVTFLHILCSI